MKLMYGYALNDIVKKVDEKSGFIHFPPCDTIDYYDMKYEGKYVLREYCKPGKKEYYMVVNL